MTPTVPMEVSRRISSHTQSPRLGDVPISESSSANVERVTMIGINDEAKLYLNHIDCGTRSKHKV